MDSGQFIQNVRMKDHLKIRSGEKYFQCEICLKKFVEESKLLKHSRAHIGEKTFQCEICKKNFAVKDELLKHSRIHIGEKSFQCEICEHKFARKNYLLIHRRIHTGEKPFRCEICEKKFVSKCQLRSHARIHTGEKPFQCEICQKKFIAKRELLTHSRIHTGEKPFQCEICEKKFGRKDSMINHMRIHTGEKPFKCEICEKKFASNGNLWGHSKLHIGEKPFKCEICEKKFPLKSQLTSHGHIHTGEKPFQCEICQKKFMAKHEIVRHNRIHTGEKPFQCEICEKKFGRKDSMINHMRIHTGEKPFECEICEKKFTSNDNLRGHSKLHIGEKPFQCEICKKNFVRKHAMISHMWIHKAEKLFKCEICQKQFIRKSRLLKHSRIHTSEKPFQCDICEKKFAIKELLICHVKIHIEKRPFKSFSLPNILKHHMSINTDINKEEETVKVEYHHLDTENLCDLGPVKSENDAIVSIKTEDSCQTALIPKLANNVDNIISTSLLNLHNDTVSQLKEEAETELLVSYESVTNQTNERESSICSELVIDNRIIHESHVRAIDKVTVHRNQVVIDNMSTNTHIPVEYHHLDTEMLCDLGLVKSENDAIVSIKTEEPLCHSALIPKLSNNVDYSISTSLLNDVHNDTVIQLKEESGTQSLVSYESVMKNRVTNQTNERAIDKVTVHRNQVGKELQDNISANMHIPVEYLHLDTENLSALLPIKSENDSIVFIKTEERCPSNHVDNISTNLLNVHNDTVSQLKEESGTELLVSYESLIKNIVTNQTNGRESLNCNEPIIDNSINHESHARTIDKVTVYRNQVVKELQDKISTNTHIQDDNDIDRGDHDFSLLPTIDMSKYFP